MISFYEFLGRQKGVGLPDPATMLAKLGITPDVPHEIDLMRMVKQMKQADAQAKMKPSAASRTVRLPQPAPDLFGKRSPS